MTLDPQNAFTLNNLGVAEEAMGNFEGALQHYDQAANLNSPEPIVVTLKKSWRGKPVSRMAADSAQQLRNRMQNMNSAEARAIMLTFRGIYATNENDWGAAKRDFQQAYTLNPQSAFSLNNLGYVAEKDGDLETAQFYYSKARKAEDASSRIGLATQRDAEGQNLVAIASESNGMVKDEIDEYSHAERMQTEPVELIHRDNIPAQPNIQTQPGSTSAPTRSLAAPNATHSKPSTMSSTPGFSNFGSQASN